MKDSRNTWTNGMEVPEWLDVSAWEAWVEVRRSMKRVPFTERVQRMWLEDLTEWHDQGLDTRWILRQAAKRGWRGLFPEGAPRIRPAAKPRNEQYSLQIEERLAKARKLGVDVDTIQ